MIMSIVPLFEAITFWALLRNPNSIPKQNSEPKYRQTLADQENGTLMTKGTKLSVGDKLRYMPSLMKYLVPFLLIFLFQYFINQGLVSERRLCTLQVLPILNIIIFFSAGIGVFQKHLVGP